MLENWLNPTTVPTNIEWSSLPKNCLGKHIEIFEQQLPLLQDIQIVLIGLDAANADAIRQSLYKLSFNFPKVKIADLGNLKKTTASFIIPVLKELHDTNILPILIGGQTEHIYAQYQAHYAKRALTNLVVLDERVHFDLEEEQAKDLYLTKILQNRKLFNLSVLGCQGHYVPLDVKKYFSKRYFELFNLGKVRSNMEELEPILRDADLMAVNLDAIRNSDVSGVPTPSPNGLFGEEACQIHWYAGMSDKLSSIGFYGYHHDLDEQAQGAQLLAQMLWHFLNGFYHRKNDFPKSTDNLTEYIVEQKSLDHQITFWKSTKSGRWWMQVPIKTRKKHERHFLIPCSYKDYQLACNGELPERLVSAYQRFL